MLIPEKPVSRPIQMHTGDLTIALIHGETIVRRHIHTGESTPYIIVLYPSMALFL